MSALPPKADIACRQLDVRFVPIADMANVSRRPRRHRSFEERVSTSQERFRPPFRPARSLAVVAIGAGFAIGLGHPFKIEGMGGNNFALRFFDSVQSLQWRPVEILSQQECHKLRVVWSC